MRGKHLIKFFRAVELLAKPEGTTIEEMAAHLEIDRRSVYRMIELIEELGFPLYDEAVPLEKRKRWKLEESYLKKLPNMTVPDINLGLSEIIALYLLKGEEKLYRGTELEKTINAAFAKISMFVPDGLFGQLDKIKTLFTPNTKFTKDYSGKEKIIDDLMEAMLQRKTCQIEYHAFSDDTLKKYKIDPLNFFENDGGLYLFVRVADYEDIRVLAVERIRELSVTNSSFTYPADFNPESVVESAFNVVFDDPIEVKIWFSADQARYIKERKWSPTQKIKEQKDGSIILSMQTSGWWDIKKWVLSYGAEAKVLEPKELKEEIVEELTNAYSNYK